jgi:hypothetical protein
VNAAEAAATVTLPLLKSTGWPTSFARHHVLRVDRAFSAEKAPLSTEAESRFHLLLFGMCFAGGGCR